MRFSVIVPLYNKAPYVIKALRSILEQTFQDFELIVVDDGSTDDSLSIAKDVVKGTSATIISQTNAGVSTARNNGVSVSNGDYICFLDADDWWEPQFLDGMNELINSYPEAGVYGISYYYVKNREKYVRLNIPTGYINYCKEYAKSPSMPIWTGAACIPRNVFNEFYGFKSNLKLGEDFDLWIRISLKYKVAFLNKPLSNYNQDVNINNRLIGRLQKPENHMLWNLDYLASEEKSNTEYKQLIDNLRTYGLFPYYLSRKYHKAAKEQLTKVDWEKQPASWQKLYKKPVCCLRVRQEVLHIGAICKRFVRHQIPSFFLHLAAKKWEIGIIEGGINEVMNYSRPKIQLIKHQYKDRYFADPFIYDVNDKDIILFAEEYKYSERKGSIVLLKVDRNSLQLTCRKSLLEKVSNVSFPFIQRIGGDVFICPENGDSGQWISYKYDTSNESLNRYEAIIEEPLIDAVLTNRFEKKMILATTTDSPNGNVLSIWTFNEDSKSYKPSGFYKFNNRIARNGGDIFEWNGKIFRPAQDCNKCYGERLIIQEFLCKKGNLEFKDVKVLEPPKHRLYIGLHTLNSYLGISAVDLHSFKIPILGSLITNTAHIFKRR